MPDVINVHDAKTHLSRLLDRARDGEEIILGKAGKPYAKLVPIEPAKNPGERELGFLNGWADDEAFLPLTDDELADWEGPLVTPATTGPQSA